MEKKGFTLYQMDRIPTDHHPVAPKTRGGSTLRRDDGNEIEVSNQTHGNRLPSNHNADILHDWMGYRNYSLDHHGAELEHSLPNHHQYQHYYYNPPYYRHSTQDVAEQHSLSFDDIPSPPYQHHSQEYSPFHRRHDPVPLYSSPPGFAMGGEIFRRRRDLGTGQLDYTSGQPSNSTRFPSSTKVTPIRPLRPETEVLTEASRRRVSSVHRPSSIGQGHGRKSIDTRRIKSSSSSAVIWSLGEYDVLCGRGAPTNYHSGNLFLRNLVTEYQTVYLCSKRSDKPAIAWKLLDIVSSRGGRFVRRNKTQKSSNFAWEQLTDKQAYEKICQALREGAPEFRRRMLQDMMGGRSCSLDDPLEGEEVAKECGDHGACDCSTSFERKGDDTEECKEPSSPRERTKIDEESAGVHTV